MDKRFCSLSTEKSVQKSNNAKFDAKELKKTTVIIKRNISSSSETKEVDRTLEKPEEIKIYRCRGEGSRPIFDRSDVVVNKEETEQRTVSSCPQRSPNRQNVSHKSSDNYTSFGSGQETPARGSRNRNSSSPYRNKNSHRYSRPDLPQRDTRNRSRSRDKRRSRSRSRSSRREFRRRNTRSPDERDRRRYERRNYEPNERERDRQHERRRSPRYARSPPRRRSRSRPPHMAPIDPATVIPLIIPRFYGPEDAIWFTPPMRPPMMMPPGPMSNRGMYRAPMPGFRPHLPPRPPFEPYRQQPFRQIRPQNRPQLQ